MRIFVRGCPGQGTTWFARVLRLCTYSLLGFENVTVSSVKKHAGCHKNSPSDAELPHAIWSHSCFKPSCVHAVIARHPMEMKHGRAGAYRVWEAYYGTWMRSVVHANRTALLFRYEDLVRSEEPCIRQTVPDELKRSFFQRRHDHPLQWNEKVWRYWNYSN